ncbi:hypothetical protein [Helicobacter rodentium]|uniref:hypothetical protein n=1 Tax=Helicobacter rodentium TaxID=59617 RepID=UPI0023536346|nr:hypothetical protein [Helicobacter rodentium]
MKLIAQITLASILGFALVGCGASGTKANLVDNFADDFGTFKKQVAECEKVVTYGVWGNPYHKELVQSYIDEIKEINQKARKIGSASELESLAKKQKTLEKEMGEYQLSEEEVEKYNKTCAELNYTLAKYIQNQAEYDIYKAEYNNRKASQEFQNLIKELKARAKKEENSKK